MSTILPFEIERKYRVNCIPPNIGIGTHLRQWYIPITSIECNESITLNDIKLVSKIKKEWVEGVNHSIQGNNSTIRIRLDGKLAILCIKGKTKGITRMEFEWDIGNYLRLEEFLVDSDWPMIEKRRWKVKSQDNHEWDLDQFLGLNEGLWLAEIELENENEQYICPKWVGNDVSNDRRFSSKQLAKRPFSEFNETEIIPLKKC